MEYVNDKIFKQQDFSIQALQQGEYEVCRFEHCNFADANFTNYKFIDCEFVSSNLSNATLNGTAFQDVKFRFCKLLGLAFEDCNDFLLAMEFDNCLLNHASFFKKKVTKTLFTNCQLHEVDFTETNLSESNFEHCDLAGAVFSNTNSEKVNFEMAFNFSIDPGSNRIKKARFSAEGLAGLLGKYDIIIN